MSAAETHSNSESPIASTILSKTDGCDRIEPIPKPGFPHHKYPRWIGHKFSPDGATLPYPGNTIIAHLPAGTPFHHALHELLASLQSHELASAFAFLPPSSWHMTLYEGVTDQIRLRTSYPGDLPLDSSLNVCHAHVATRLAEFAADLQPAGVGEMEVVGFEPVEDGLGLTLRATDASKEVQLRRLRDRLGATLKMRHPGHATYSWHMALAYTLRRLEAEEKATIEAFLEAWLERSTCRSFVLDAPEFCVYSDMCSFRRMFSLE